MKKTKNKAQNIAREFLLKYKGGLLTLKGDSMQPVFEEGWKARVQPLDYEEIRYGDVVALSRRDIFIVHRVIGKFQRKGMYFFLEKGDNTPIPKTMPRDSIIGKVVEVFDENGIKVDDKQWQQHNKILTLYSAIISFIYKLLNYIKFSLVGYRRIRLTRFAYYIYWKSCLLFFSQAKACGYQRPKKSPPFRSSMI